MAKNFALFPYWLAAYVDYLCGEGEIKEKDDDGPEKGRNHGHAQQDPQQDPHHSCTEFMQYTRTVQYIEQWYVYSESHKNKQFDTD